MQTNKTYTARLLLNDMSILSRVKLVFAILGTFLGFKITVSLFAKKGPPHGFD